MFQIRRCLSQYHRLHPKRRQNKMVNFMSTQYLTLRLRPVVPNMVFPLASAALLLCGSITANAAMQAEPSEDWASSIFSGYGITIMLVLGVIGRFVYKWIRVVMEPKEFGQPRGRRR